VFDWRRRKQRGLMQALEKTKAAAEIDPTTFMERGEREREGCQIRVISSDFG